MKDLKNIQDIKKIKYIENINDKMGYIDIDN